MTELPASPKPAETRKPRAFRRAVFRGLGIVMPPLLTIVLFLWAWNVVESNVLQPMENAAHRLFLWSQAEVVDAPPEGVPLLREGDGDQALVTFAHEGRRLVRLGDGRFVRRDHFDEYQRLKSRADRTPNDADEFYRRYVQIRYPRRLLLPLALGVFVLFVYGLGRFMAFSVGRMLWNAAEGGVVNRLPVIRNVYSSVKQVTDMFFSDREEMRFTRVVAVEYPRHGIWALAFVTGESFVGIRAALNEPVVAVLIPTSPVPAAGFTATVRKSETIDLNITVDQAIQFIVSCGVVAPPYSFPDDKQQLAAHIEQSVLSS